MTSLDDNAGNASNGDFDGQKANATSTSSSSTQPVSTHDQTPITMASHPQPSVDSEKQRSVPSGPGPPPDGGLVAWLQVVGGFFLNFNTW